MYSINWGKFTLAMSRGGIKELGLKRCAGISERQQARRKTEIHSGSRGLLRDERSIKKPAE